MGTVTLEAGVDTQVHAVIGALSKTIAGLNLGAVAAALLDELGDVLGCDDRVGHSVGDAGSEGSGNSRGKASGEETEDEGGGEHLED